MRILNTFRNIELKEPLREKVDALEKQVLELKEQLASQMSTAEHDTSSYLEDEDLSTRTRLESKEYFKL